MTSAGDAAVAGDRGRVLWHLAHAGAELRRAGQLGGHGDLAAWDPRRLDLGGAPRAVLVATDPATSLAADLLRVLAAPVAPVGVLGSPQLPRFAGAADAVVVVSLDGRHPRLAALAEQAARRGCQLLVVAPAGSPVAAAAGRGVVVDLPRDTASRAAGWTVLGPVLLAAQVWGLVPPDPRRLEDLADAVDDVSHACRPASDAVANPARSLAEEFTEAQPVVVGAGPLAGVAADRFARALRLIGGVPALALHLPDDVAQVTAVLAAPEGGAEQDFFRDRVDEPAALPRLLLVGGGGPPDDPDALGRDTGSPHPADDPHEQEAHATARIVEQAARAAGVRATTLAVPGGDPLVRFVAAVQTGLFTATYVALGRGTDPSTPRPGELP